jgi:hypothetical protein
MVDKVFNECTNLANTYDLSADTAKNAALGAAAGGVAVAGVATAVAGEQFGKLDDSNGSYAAIYISSGSGSIKVQVARPKPDGGAGGQQSAVRKRFQSNGHPPSTKSGCPRVAALGQQKDLQRRGSIKLTVS